jgi:hypothetical protein
MKLTGYALFSPVAIALGILVLGWGVFPKFRTQPGFLKATVTLWFLSALVILGFVFVGREMGYGIIWQRDIGYVVGGFTALLLPFALVAAVLRIGINSIHRKHVILTLVAASGVTALVLYFFPTFFFVGWVLGCVLTGYPSCI